MANILVSSGWGKSSIARSALWSDDGSVHVFDHDPGGRITFVMFLRREGMGRRARMTGIRNLLELVPAFRLAKRVFKGPDA